MRIHLRPFPFPHASFKRRKPVRLARRIGIFLVAILPMAGMAFPSSVQARDTPPILQGFAYGVHLDQDGLLVEAALDVAAKMELDWVSLTFDWEGAQPDPAGGIDWGGLGMAIPWAQGNGLSVLLKITHAPAWALTANGPDPNRTAEMVTALRDQFPALDAVELFPAANTQQGWGAPPNPRAYLDMLVEVSQRMGDPIHAPLLVAGGLKPLSQDGPPGDIPDLDFLDAVYQMGGAEWMRVVSLQLSGLNGEPMSNPFDSSTPVLRHYERIREIMLQNGHKDGTLWITSFSWPSGTIKSGDAGHRQSDYQAEWLYQALSLLNSQLYIGAAFFNQLNPPSSILDELLDSSLIQADGTPHPGLGNLGRLIRYDKHPTETVGQTSDPLRPLFKHLRSPKSRFKPDP